MKRNDVTHTPTRTREERLAYIQRLLADGQWEERHDLVLARRWGLSHSTVRDLAAEARRALRRQLSPEGQEDLRAQLAARLDRVYRKAIRSGDFKAAVAAVREQARLGGLDSKTITLRLSGQRGAEDWLDG